MNRLTLRDVRMSRVPAALGICASDTPTLCSYLNEATPRLVQAGGDSGWYGTWVKMVFNTSRANPFITSGRDVARIINMDVCRTPIRIQNEFYEFLEFGIGLQSPLPTCQCRDHVPMTAFDRGTYPTMTDLTPGNKIRLYFSNSADQNKRLFFNAVDSNGLQIYTLDNGLQVNGFFMMLTPPFIDSPMALNSIAGIQKDTTLGPVSIYQVDATTGAQSLLATLAPDESVPQYRRYFIHGLPCHCRECDSTPNVVQVTGMAKLEFIPVRSDTDYLLIGNLPALKEECMAIRYEEMDGGNSKEESQFHHIQAIRLLNKELKHYMGTEMPALNFAPFGTASFNKLMVGMT